MQRNTLTTPEAAALLGLSVHTLNKWRWDGRGPRYLKLGKSVRYRREDVEQFLDDAARENTSAGAA